MLHEMKLKSEEFDNIKYNNKVIEVRLNDSKRKLIKQGDKIVFYKLPNLNEYIIAKVEKIYHFSTFRQLYNRFPSSLFGYTNLDIDEKLKRIYEIYSPEQEKDNGVVAIKFHIQNI